MERARGRGHSAGISRANGPCCVRARAQEGTAAPSSGACPLHANVGTSDLSRSRRQAGRPVDCRSLHGAGWETAVSIRRRLERLEEAAAVRTREATPRKLTVEEGVARINEMFRRLDEMH